MGVAGKGVASGRARAARRAEQQGWVVVRGDDGWSRRGGPGFGTGIRSEEVGEALLGIVRTGYLGGGHFHQGISAPDHGLVVDPTVAADEAIEAQA